MGTGVGAIYQLGFHLILVNNLQLGESAFWSLSAWRAFPCAGDPAPVMCRRLPLAALPGSITSLAVLALLASISSCWAWLAACRFAPWGQLGWPWLDTLCHGITLPSLGLKTGLGKHAFFPSWFVTEGKLFFFPSVRRTSGDLGARWRPPVGPGRTGKDGAQGRSEPWAKQYGEDKVLLLSPSHQISGRSCPCLPL